LRRDICNIPMGDPCNALIWTKLIVKNSIPLRKFFLVTSWTSIGLRIQCIVLGLV
jgi:hypothetical protein